MMKKLLLLLIAVVLLTSCNDNVLLNIMDKDANLLFGEDKEQADEPQPTALVVSLSYRQDTAVLTVNGTAYNLIKVNGSTFQMGSYDEIYLDEQPVRSVTLSDYYIGQTEVTQKIWTAIMGYNLSQWKGDDMPVGKVSWYQCMNFIDELNRMTGSSFSLPTEAQWEFAARGGNFSNGYLYSGSNMVGLVAWYARNCSMTQPVGLKYPNELGLYDMTGNVNEWCSDWYWVYPSGSQTDPVGPSSGDMRVVRGGCCADYEDFCRTTHRQYRYPDYRDEYTGFRLVLK